MNDDQDGKKTNIFRLRKLPPVFDISDMAKFLEISPQVASQYCWRWKAAGLIKPANKKGVYYNSFLYPDIENHLGLVVVKAISRPFVVSGVSALRNAGWTTQIPQNLEINVAVTRDFRTITPIDNVFSSPRSAKWFEDFYPRTKLGPFGLPTLVPAVALADIIAWTSRNNGAENIWEARPDDISIDDVNEDTVMEILEAARKMDVPDNVTIDYLRGIESFQDVLDDVSDGVPVRP